MAVQDYFLKIEGIDGESTDAKHKGEIDLESYSFGATNSGGHSYGGGGGSGKVSMNDFSFVMKINKATPKLMLACASGQHIPKAILTARKAGGNQEEFMKVTFSDLLVSSYHTSGSGGADVVPTEQISLNFAKIEFEYKPQKPDGTLDGAVKTGWSLKNNEKV